MKKPDIEIMDSFIARFTEMRNAIADGDSTAVERMIAEGAAAKREELLARERGDQDV